MTSLWLRDPALADLKLICYLLNGGGELPPEIPEPHGALPAAIVGLRPELRRLVTAWKDSGFNAEKLMSSDRSVSERLERMTARLVPTQGAKFRLAWPSLEPPRRSRLPTTSEQWQDFAFAHFANLLLNPRCEMLGGPCGRCGRYYVKKTVRQKVFCNRRCDKAAGAATATRKRRDSERADKLNQAQAAACKWNTLRPKLDWKRWVSRETGVSLTFLTQAVNNRKLQPPESQES